MTLTIDIPEDVVEAMKRTGHAPARAALEAIALEGYRGRWLSESGVRRLLGFPTRLEVHGFLKEHGVYLNYGIEDLEHDLKEVERYYTLKGAPQPPKARA